MSEASPSLLPYKIAAGALIAGLLVATNSRQTPTVSQKVKPVAIGANGAIGVAMNPDDRRILGAGSQTSSMRAAPVVDGNTVVVYYDSVGQFGYLGDLYSKQIATLLSHFSYKVVRSPIETYAAGDLQKARASFYLGLIYDNKLPDAFKADAMASAKPLCWMGYNLWQIAWTPSYAENTAFSSKFGFRFLQVDTIGYPTVTYKGVDLTKEQTDPTQGKIQVLDATKAKVTATSKRPDGLSIPYITKANNLWYIGDNPLSYVTFRRNDDRLLSVEDTIHDVISSGAVEDHRAVLRIEDVNPNVPPATLTKLADALYAQNIPYVICVIPTGVTTTNGVCTYHSVHEDYAFQQALHYMEARGGQVVMHGWTHQYSNLPNPYNGNSGTDYEFFRVMLANDGTETPVGFVPEDSSAWSGLRVDCGLLLMRLAGFNPKGWVTPHYIASPSDLTEVSKRFEFSLCRSLTYATGPDGKAYYTTLLSPWVIRDMFGQKHIPETIGYVNPEVFAGIPPRLPADLIGYSKAVKVVRDGWAGCYFHWFLDPALLTQLVSGIKAQGYRFVAPSGATQ